MTGGTATRLTAHPGLELFAKFSPDGKTIAFTGQYDGDEQVYVVPVTGGVPKQLTFYPARGPLTERWGYDNQVYGWTPDGKRVLFRSLRDGWTLVENHLYTVSAEGGSAVQLPMPTAGAGAFSPDGKQMVYSPLFRDFRSEKRYGGGQANRLWIFDLAGKTAKPISEGPRAERDPMWLEKTIYYNTDKTGTFNLWTYDIASGQRRQVTQGTTWDVRWPSLGDGGRIVYELGGELQVLDTKTRAVHADLHHGADRRCRVPPVAYLGGRCDRMVQREPKGRAGAVRGTRRCLHGANRERPDPEPDEFVGSPRSRRALVS